MFFEWIGYAEEEVKLLEKELCVTYSSALDNIGKNYWEGEESSFMEQLATKETIEKIKQIEMKKRIITMLKENANMAFLEFLEAIQATTARREKGDHQNESSVR